MKRCPRCGETKPLSDFHIHRGRRDGVQTYCKRCRAVIDHDRYERIRATRVPTRTWERGRAEWLLSLKSGRPCTDCGRLFPPQVMPGITYQAFPSLATSATASTGTRVTRSSTR